VAVRHAFARRSVLRDRLYPKPYYRLVYGESDGLPGLIVDRFRAKVAVVQIGTAGMERLKEAIQAALIGGSALRRCAFKNDGSTRDMEGLPSYTEVVRGSFDQPARVYEDGLEFQAPLTTGQKTGWFFRSEAAIDAPYRNISGRRPACWTVFSYVGAWGVRGGATHGALVTCVDSSAAAHTKERPQTLPATASN